MRVLIIMFLAVVSSSHTYADDRKNLVLRAYVPPAISTRVTQTQLSSFKSLVIFSSQINSKYLRESQKFEVEGLDQFGIEGRIRKVAGNDRTIQYDLLINHLSTSLIAKKPIFLKISAN